MDEDSTKLLLQSLEAAGLEPSYWSPILAKKLGVITVQGREYVGAESYAILRQFSRNPKETKVIKKFLKITSEEKCYQLQRKQVRMKLEVRQKEYQKMLLHLKNAQRERKEQEIQHTYRLIFEILQMPPESRFSKNMNPEEVYQQLKIFNENISNALKEDDQDAASLIQTASGGLALRGIYLTRKLDDQLQQRDILLKVPTNIELEQPSHAEHEKIKVFSISKEEDEFNRAVKMLGYSVVAISRNGFNFDELCNVKEEDSNEVGIDEHGKTYYCTVKHCAVPLSSCYLKCIQLSDDAVKHLLQIEELVISNSKQLQTECEEGLVHMLAGDLFTLAEFISGNLTALILRNQV